MADHAAAGEVKSGEDAPAAMALDPGVPHPCAHLPRTAGCAGQRAHGPLQGPHSLGVCAQGCVVCVRNERMCFLQLLAHGSVPRLAPLGPCGLVVSINAAPLRGLLTRVPSPPWSPPGPLSPLSDSSPLSPLRPQWPPAEAGPACLLSALPAALAHEGFSTSRQCLCQALTGKLVPRRCHNTRQWPHRKV